MQYPSPMLYRSLVLVCALFLTACSSPSKPDATSTAAARAQTPPQPPPPPPLTDEQRALHIASFDKVWETVRDQHWDPNLNGVDWNAARDELRPRVEQAQSAADARAAMQDLIERLGQSHFGIIPASTYGEIKARPTPAAAESSSADSATSSSASTDTTPSGQAETEPAPGADDADDDPAPNKQGSIGMWTRVVDNAAIVSRVLPDSPAARAGIAPGWQVTKIDGRPVARTIERITETYRDSTMLEAMLAMGLTRRADGQRGDSVTLTLIDGAGAERTIKLVSETPAGTPANFGNLPTIYVTTHVRRLDGNIGYIAFSAFLDPARVMPIINAAIAEFADADGIIIDLRGNIGGIGIMASGVGNHFVTERNLKLGSMKTRESELKFVLNPRPKPNTKPLAILVDGVSLSTSEILAGGLQDLGRARVFGTRTGGAALPSQIMKLPNGDGFQFAFANYTSTGGRVLEGVGVIPDEVVPPSREALLQGRDPVIDAATRWIHAQKSQ